MRKRIFLTLVAPLVITASIVGTGLSVWFFGNGSYAEVNAAVKITPYRVEDIFSFSIPADTVLIMDQTKEMRDKIYPDGNNLPEALGVHFRYRDSTGSLVENKALPISITPNEGAVIPADFDGSHLYYEASITGLSSYLEIGATSGYIELSFDSDYTASVDLSCDSTLSLDWKEGAEPEDADAYDVLSRALAEIDDKSLDIFVEVRGNVI